ncbi:NADPH-dependent F420 reductase [Galactobacter valiniphilus]|uniref:NADPH-dependent F420 reductase n=1 Tax=Galactobacter valiniphilus TaxID=2676122 RepID=UPI001F2FC15E|nr:NAD(P)-binding domain-containing protein [Galactobacter valiniphilus]
MSNPASPLKVAVLGAGHVGTVLARLSVAAGHDVRLATTRDARELALIADFLVPGVTATSIPEAVSDADLVIAAVPLHRYRTLDVEALRGKVVVDLMNYWAGTDGRIDEFEVPDTSAEVIAAFLDGSQTVKTLNHIGYHEMESDHRPAGDPERRAVALAGNDEDAKALVARFLDEIGFDPVDAGDLAASAGFQPGTPIFNGSFDAQQMRAALDVAVPEPQRA